MRVNSVLNKIEIFRDFYFEYNGVKLSYNEAVKMFYRMDEATENDFIQYYIDKTDYELVDKDGNLISPFASASGYNLDPEISVGDKSEGVWDRSNLVSKTLPLVEIQYMLESYAQKNGYNLDSEWAQYSAEEIIAMSENGVVIPDDVLKLAYEVMNDEAQNNNENVENVEGEESSEEKKTFLELIPEAKKDIKKCEETNDKIGDKIDDLLNETKQSNKDMLEKIEEQKASLKEYEEMIREWRQLQDKINNGEALSDTEARRYAEITGMLEDKNNNSDDFQLNKNKVAISLNEINILAVLGEQLAQETIEVGEEIQEYTANDNFETTQNEVKEEVGGGFLANFIAYRITMMGKELGKDAVEIGGETKEYTSETANSVLDIAQVLGAEKLLANSSSSSEAPVEGAQADAVEQTADEAEESSEPQIDEEQATAEEATNENDTIEEDFIINDENVLALIDETVNINTELLKQIETGLENIKIAKEDEEFVNSASKYIEKTLKEFKEEEKERQEEIAQKEQENQEAQERTEEIGGGEKAEENKKLAEEYGVEQENENQSEIDEQQSIIDQNNQDIEIINQESEQDLSELKTKTDPLKEEIDKSVEEETEANTNDTKYKEEIIPADSERIDFTNNSGKTLAQMGIYRITVGQEILSRAFFNRSLWKLGIKHIVKGTTSMGIGLAAMQVSDTKIPELAEKTTNESVASEDKVLNSLTDLDAKIIESTGDESAEEKTDEISTGESTEEDEKNNEEGTLEEGVSETEETQVPAKPENVENAVKKPVLTEQPKNFSDKSVDASTSNEGNNSSKSSKSNSKKEMSTDKAGDVAKDAKSTAKDDAKDSAQIKKDTEKDEKQLKKEAKKLEKEMKRDEKQIIKMTKESSRAAKKQQELMVRYEQLTAENEAIASEEEAKKSQSPTTVVQQPQGGQNGLVGATNSFGITDSSQASSGDNAAKMEANNLEITSISGEFKAAGNKITRNRTKILNLQKSTKVKSKKYSKKIKTAEKKVKEAEKTEQDKQKRLSKQLAIVGVAENVFSITLSAGQIMVEIIAPPLMANPFTAAAGVAIESAGNVLIAIGQYGVLACGLAKAAINIANGNLTAGLISLGQTAITAVSSMTGTGAAAGNVFSAVSNGLSIVSSTAEMVNNVRTLQGKEESGIASIIGTTAAVGAAVAGIGAGFSNSKSFDHATNQITTTASAFSKAGTFGKIAQIGSALGSLMSSASQLMSEFGWGSEEIRNMLGTVGGAISTAASVAQLMSFKKAKTDKDNKENTDNVEKNAENEEDKSTDKPEEKDETDKKADETSKPVSETPSTQTNENTETAKTTEEAAKVDEVQKQAAEAEQKQEAQEAANKENTEAVNKNAEAEQKPADKKQKLQEAKEAKANQKEEIKKADEKAKTTQTENGEKAKGLTKDEKNNMKNGASDDYKDVNDEVLAQKVEDAEAKKDGAYADLDDEQLDNELKMLDSMKSQSETIVNLDDDQLKAKIDELTAQAANPETPLTSEQQSELETYQAEQEVRELHGKATGEQERRNLIKEKESRTKYREQMKTLADHKAKKVNKINGVIDIAGQAANVASTMYSMFASEDKTDVKKSKGIASSGYEYTHNSRFESIAKSNENYFGGGHEDDQKRRFKKFKKRYA